MVGYRRKANFGFKSGSAPGRRAEEDELRELLRAADGAEDCDHGGEGMADERAALDFQGVEDLEEVVDVGIESGIPLKVEVIGIDAAGTGEIIEYDAIIAGEVRHDSLPHRLIGPETVSQHQKLLPGSDHPHVQDLEQVPPSCIHQLLFFVPKVPPFVLD